MDINWGSLVRPDGSTRQQIEISSSADWDLFDLLVVTLSGGLGGQWCEKLDGLDQRYWDLQRDSAIITLHLEHYLGITAFPADGAASSSASAKLLNDAYELLADYDPPNTTMQTDRPSADR